MKRTSLVSSLLVCIATGCGGGEEMGMPDASDAGVDALPIDAMVTVDAASLPDEPLMPQTLSETGLYEDIASGTISPLVREYQPAGELWSDGATKRRWVYLPPGTTIDTSDMDYWVYPVGTRLWKEFVRDGVRVETRLLYKTGPAEWHPMAYVWLDDESDAEAAPFGRNNARGTEHDVPKGVDCLKCHEGMPDRVLGFSALQLDHDLDGLTLADLVQQGELSNPPANPPAGAGTPYFPLPGDGATQLALRYLHANCGGCHNPRSYVEEVSIALHLTVGQLDAVESTPIFTSTVGVDSMSLLPPPGTTVVIDPGSLETSSLYQRMNSRQETYSMPLVGSELVDESGVAAIGAWIEALAPIGSAGVAP